MCGLDEQCVYWEKRVAEVGPDRAAWDADDLAEGTERCLDALAHEDLIGSAAGPILDLGCGPGRLTVPLATLYPEREFVGLDISQCMLDEARGRAVALPSRNAWFVRGDGRAIPDDDRTYAGAFSVLCFQHLPDHVMKGYIAAVGERLVDGGWFRFQFIEGDGEHGPFSFARPMDRVVGWLAEAGLVPWPPLRGLVMDEWTWVTAIKGSAA